MASSRGQGGVEVSAESAVRERRSQWDHSVTGKALSVQPVGHPISSSKKRGFKSRAFFEETPPGLKIARAWCEKGRLAGRNLVARMSIDQLSKTHSTDQARAD